MIQKPARLVFIGWGAIKINARVGALRSQPPTSIEIAIALSLVRLIEHRVKRIII